MCIKEARGALGIHLEAKGVPVWKNLGITTELHDPPCIPVLGPLFHHTDGRGMLAQLDLALVSPAVLHESTMPLPSQLPQPLCLLGHKTSGNTYKCRHYSNIDSVYSMTFKTQSLSAKYLKLFD